MSPQSIGKKPDLLVIKKKNENASDSDEEIADVQQKKDPYSHAVADSGTRGYFLPNYVPYTKSFGGGTIYYNPADAQTSEGKTTEAGKQLERLNKRLNKSKKASKYDVMSSVREGSDFPTTVMDFESDVVPDSDSDNFDSEDYYARK